MSYRYDKNGDILHTGERYNKRDKSYQFRKMENGITISVSAKTLDELRIKEKEIQRSQMLGVAFSNIILNDLFNEFIETVKARNIKEQSYKNYQRLWRLYIQDSIGKRKVNEIRSAELLKFINKTRQEKGLSYNSIKCMFNVLNMTFNYALKSDLIFKNPCFHLLDYIGKEETKAKKPLSERQCEFIASWLENHHNIDFRASANIFVLGCNTGMRIGEILALTWSDIDFKNETIDVNKTLTELARDNYKMSISSTKTNSSNRIIPMREIVKDTLKKQRILQFAKGNNNVELDSRSDFVFVKSEGCLFRTKQINYYLKQASKYYNQWEIATAEKENRKPELIENISSHYMRHTYSTNLVNKGINIKTVQSIMGHSSIQTTIDLYTHDSIEQNKKEIKKLDQISV